jgi:hypothetical protein
MPDLVAFLIARYGEEQQLAEAATPGEWVALDGGVQALDGSGEPQWPVSDTESERSREDRVHIAYWDPARVLADIAAKRKLLHWCANEVLSGVDLTGMEKPGWSVHASRPGRHVEVFTAAFALRTLAAPYAGHSDFDPGWRIDG